MKEVMKVNKLSKIYRRKNGLRTKYYALKDVSLTLYENEILGIVGESGSGKSTLLRLIAGLEKASSGDVTILGHSLQKMLKKNHLTLRRQMQLIYQNPYEVFDPRQTIEQILLQPLKIHHLGGKREEQKAIVLNALRRIGFEPAEAYLNRHPHELSGGQLQRISILRSLLLEPQIILADEPVSMLDASIRSELLAIFKELQEEEGKSILMVSHDILPLIKIANRLLVLYQGSVVEIIAADKIRDQAIHPYTLMLVANALGEEVSDEQLKPFEKIRIEPSDEQLDNLIEVAAGHWVRKY